MVPPLVIQGSARASFGLMIDGAASAAAAALALLMRLLRVIFMGYLLRVVGCSRVFPVSFQQ
jgi:hypothetical protein